MTAIPSLTTGNTITQTAVQTLAQLNTGFGLFAAGSVLTGSSPPTGQPAWLMQSSTNVPPALPGTIVFPVAFPHGVLTVVATNGDTGGVAGAPLVSGVTLSQFTVSITGYSGAARINYIAIGW